MISVALAYIFNTKFINYKGEKDKSPFVAPQTRGEGALVVVVLEKERLWEVVGEDSGLRETIDAITDFEIHPAIVDVFVEFILVNEILRDVGELDFDVFGIVKWC